MQSGKQLSVTFLKFHDKLKKKYADIFGKSLKIDGSWDWHWDSNFKWDNDSNRVAFRRCSGDVDKPICPLYSVDISDGKSELTPTLVAENLSMNDKSLLNYIPVGYVTCCYFLLL